MRECRWVMVCLLLGMLAAPGLLRAQEATPAPAPAPTPAPTPEPKQEPAAEKPARESVPFRAIEGPIVINLPSVDTPSPGTLTLLFTHRFQTKVQDSSIHDLFSLDNGANIGIGLAYSPLKNLDAGFYRWSDLDVYELSARYHLFSSGGFDAGVRLGEDWRTETSVTSPHSSFFAQVMLAYSWRDRLRVSAVPTYLQRTNGLPRLYPSPVPGDSSCVQTEFGSYLCSGYYRDIFNVPFAVSIALTHSITVHGEVTPRVGKVNASGTGWIVSIEKSLLRHRFAFTAGNQRQTTVDQYIYGIPGYRQAKDIFLGFNLVRQWKLK
jgi:hypothetical protein